MDFFLVYFFFCGFSLPQLYNSTSKLRCQAVLGIFVILVYMIDIGEPIFIDRG